VLAAIVSWRRYNITIILIMIAIIQGIIIDTFQSLRTMKNQVEEENNNVRRLPFVNALEQARPVRNPFCYLTINDCYCVLYPGRAGVLHL
jgi:hypothetical protein